MPISFAHEETNTQNLNDLLKVKEVVSIGPTVSEAVTPA